MGHQVAQDVGALLAKNIGITPQTIAGATVNGTGIDRMPQGEVGAESGVLVVISGAGAITSLDAEVQDSTDDGATDAYATLVDNEGNDVDITQITANNAIEFVDFNLENAKKWVRASVTVVGTVDACAFFVFGGGRVVPFTL